MRIQWQQLYLHIFKKIDIGEGTAIFSKNVSFRSLIPSLAFPSRSVVQGCPVILEEKSLKEMFSTLTYLK